MRFINFLMEMLIKWNKKTMMRKWKENPQWRWFSVRLSRRNHHNGKSGVALSLSKKKAMNKMWLEDFSDGGEKWRKKYNLMIISVEILMNKFLSLSLSHPAMISKFAPKFIRFRLIIILASKLSVCFLVDGRNF